MVEGSVNRFRYLTTLNRGSNWLQCCTSGACCANAISPVRSLNRMCPALHNSCVVVLTSHGDTLQVAHALCKGAGLLNSPPCSSSSCSRTKETLLGELGRHRENALANCEWRLLAHSRLNAEAL